MDPDRSTDNASPAPWAAPAGSVTVDVSVDVDDVRALARHLLRGPRQRHLRRMRAACVVALVSVWCAIVTTTAPSASSPILLVAAAAAGLMLLIVRSAAKQQRQLRRDDYAATMTADSTGLTIARPHSFTRIEWAGLEGLDVTPVRILLRTLSTTGYVIPSTCFRSAEDLRLFVTLAGGIDADNAGRA